MYVTFQRHAIGMKLKAFDRSNRTFDSFSFEVIHQFLDYFLFHLRFIHAVRCETLDELANLGGNDLLGITDFEDNHKETNRMSQGCQQITERTRADSLELSCNH